MAHPPCHSWHDEKPSDFLAHDRMSAVSARQVRMSHARLKCSMTACAHAAAHPANEALAVLVDVGKVLLRLFLSDVPSPCVSDMHTPSPAGSDANGSSC